MNVYKSCRNEKGSQSITSIACGYIPKKMFSQSYSRIFRPWDASDSKNISDKTNVDEITKKKILDEKKRENRLRKIRGTFKKTNTNLHQDATVSTTTIEEEENTTTNDSATSITSTQEEDEKITITSPVASLTQYCDRLLHSEQLQTKEKVLHDFKSTYPCIPSMYAPSYPEYLPTADIAQALGVPPTDPLLLESLAQGYAMELEYARIIQQENEAKLNARKQRPKKYKCPHCHVGFSNNGQLKGHIRIHTGERPYKCDEKNCGKTFTRNEELTRHKRIHSGVRPFPCSTCGKKFGRRDHLKKHTRTHFLQAERMMPVFVPLSAVPHVGFPYLYSY